jgi:hypothetical protein
MKKRQFHCMSGAMALPIEALAQARSMPVVGSINSKSPHS